MLQFSGEKENKKEGVVWRDSIFTPIQPKLGRKPTYPRNHQFTRNVPGAVAGKPVAGSNVI